MIAARPVRDLTRGFGRNAFDLPVAGLAGLAAAFLAFAMPAELLGRLVIATGLPHLLAAAEPPLGVKARALLGVAGAGAAFGLAYLLLRLLDRSGRAKPSAVPPEAVGDGPKLRRRDAHPDAPVCRPISAARDFGEPAPPRQEPAAHVCAPISVVRDLDEAMLPPLELDELADLPAAAADPDEAVLPPLELDVPADPPIRAADPDEPGPRPMQPDAQTCAPVSAAPDALPPPPTEPSAPIAPWRDEAEADLGEAQASESPWSRRRDLYSGRPARQPIFAVEAEAVPAAPAQAAEAIAPAMAAAPVPAWLAEPVEPAVMEPVAAAAPSPTPAADPVPESVPESAPAPTAERIRLAAEPALGPATEASLAELMRRLEQGLSSRGTGRNFLPVPQQPQAPAPQVFPEANDDRLQNAIESLQRFAARGD